MLGVVITAQGNIWCQVSLDLNVHWHTEEIEGEGHRELTIMRNPEGVAQWRA